MVQLKLYFNFFLRGDSAFQFQNGTIKADAGRKSGRRSEQFQFQNGTIKATDGGKQP